MRKKHKKNERFSYGRSTYRIVAIAIIFGVLLLVNFFPYTSGINVNQTSPPRAAIVDQLSISQPNQTFVLTATNLLEDAGYTVDYYSGEEVTIDFFKNLPTHDYDLIVLRVHSATRFGNPDAPCALFTSEPYVETKYVYEQMTDQLEKISIDKTSPKYFGIGSWFITSATGEFQDNVIIMMGCHGLSNTQMAEAFIDKGAEVYIGWNGFVSASHTDQSTIHLLQHLITEKQTVRNALIETFKELGSDPEYNSTLLWYPIEAQNYSIKKVLTPDAVFAHSPDRAATSEVM